MARPPGLITINEASSLIGLMPNTIRARLGRSFVSTVQALAIIGQ